MTIKKPSGATVLAITYAVFLVAFVSSATVIFIQRINFNEHKKIDDRYVPVKCNDIVQYADGSLVCEINMKAEDDPVNLYRKV